MVVCSDGEREREIGVGLEGRARWMGGGGKGGWDALEQQIHKYFSKLEHASYVYAWIPIALNNATKTFTDIAFPACFSVVLFEVTNTKSLGNPCKNRFSFASRHRPKDEM